MEEAASALRMPGRLHRRGVSCTGPYRCAEIEQRYTGQRRREHPRQRQESVSQSYKPKQGPGRGREEKQRYHCILWTAGPRTTSPARLQFTVTWDQSCDHSNSPSALVGSALIHKTETGFPLPVMLHQEQRAPGVHCHHLRREQVRADQGLGLW